LAVRGSTSATKSWLILGLINVAVASLLYYGTWWQADPFLYVTAIMHTPLNADEIGRLFPIGPAGAKNPSPIDLSTLPAVDRPSSWSTDAVRKVIGGVAYGWLAVATAAYALMALAGGAGLVHRRATHWHRKAAILAGGAGLALLCAGLFTWQKYGAKFPPDTLRWGMAGLLVLAVLAGSTIRRVPRGLNRLAALAVIASASATAVGLVLLGRCGAIEAGYSSVAFVVMVFAAHSLYGWLLLIPLCSASVGNGVFRRPVKGV
jgi:hypothetical protein